LNAAAAGDTIKACVLTTATFRNAIQNQRRSSMATDKTRVGFIGLGIMGRPMALNIRKAGYALVLFGENGVAAGARAGQLFIDMSTISPDATREFAGRLKQQGVDYLDAPVSGGDVGAIKGTLSIMVGGEPAAFERAKPIFETMGSRVIRVGPVGSGQTAKACNQILCGVNLMGVCEALTLAAASGLDLDITLQVLTGGASNSWSLQNLGPKIARGDLNPGFMVKLIQKDLAIVMDAAKRLNLPLPGAALSMQNFRSVQAAGGGDLGTQAMITVYEKLAERKVQGARA
jgi:3-hydroxyisobutyrate dehydrogenase